jgi:hypothetical protein
MGIGITGMSKAKLLPCSHDDECPCLLFEDGVEIGCRDDVCTVDGPAGGKDAVPNGCCVPGWGGRDYSLDFNYAAYDGWIRRLSLMALDVEPEEVWDHPRRFRGKPFVELIRFRHTGGGAIGPITSAKLHGDFVAFARRARRYYATATPNVFGTRRARSRSARIEARPERMGLANVAQLALGLTGSEFEWDEGKVLDWMWDSYRQFRRAFRLAKNAGLVAFY